MFAISNFFLLWNVKSHFLQKGTKEKRLHFKQCFEKNQETAFVKEMAFKFSRNSDLFSFPYTKNVKKLSLWTFLVTTIP